MELFTKDLVLRPVDDNDIDEVAKMWEWQKGPVSLDKAREAIRYMQDNHQKNNQGYIYHLCLAVFKNGYDRIIGWCGLDGKYPKGQRANALFYSIETDYQNKGYATQCTLRLFEYLFEIVELQRIDGGCYGLYVFGILFLFS